MQPLPLPQKLAQAYPAPDATKNILLQTTLIEILLPSFIKSDLTPKILSTAFVVAP